MTEGRILAVKIDGRLFDKLDEFVCEEGTTKQKYISELISKDISLRIQQKAQMNKELDIKHTDSVKTWDKAEVMNAIDEFMLQNRKIPRQTDFKNENGLPSYGAAGRALEMSPSEYMKERFEELVPEQQNEEIEMTM